MSDNVSAGAVEGEMRYALGPCPGGFGCTCLAHPETRVRSPSSASPPRSPSAVSDGIDSRDSSEHHYSEEHATSEVYFNPILRSGISSGFTCLPKFVIFLVELVQFASTVVYCR